MRARMARSTAWSASVTKRAVGLGRDHEVVRAEAGERDRIGDVGQFLGESEIIGQGGSCVKGHTVTASGAPQTDQRDTPGCRRFASFEILMVLFYLGAGSSKRAKDTHL